MVGLPLGLHFTKQVKALKQALGLKLAMFPKVRIRTIIIAKFWFFVAPTLSFFSELSYTEFVGTAKDRGYWVLALRLGCLSTMYDFLLSRH